MSRPKTVLFAVLDETKVIVIFLPNIKNVLQILKKVKSLVVKKKMLQFVRVAIILSKFKIEREMKKKM